MEFRELSFTPITQPRLTSQPTAAIAKDTQIRLQKSVRHA
jgi:hypothetical protein